MRFLSLFLAVAMVTAVAGPARAQDQTLADIRQELSVLFVEVQRLKRELSTTGGAGVAIGGDTLQRVDLIEAELSRLTAKTEQLEFRINRVVDDGNNVIGDLEFRLCELESGCDVSTLGQTPALGGGDDTSTAVPADTLATPAQDTQLAVGEQADFDRARAALDASDYRAAADLFANFTETYTGGPLGGEAHFYRGQALSGLGEISGAARAYLQSFSVDPQGPRAAEALLGLGTALGQLDQPAEACTTLAEVGARFPGNAAVLQAEEERRRLGCS